jgi:outer membrane murein-binding lipoprotein Lpp
LLRADLEQLRHDSDANITDKETIIQKLTQKILQYESHVIELNAEIARLSDIEKQFKLAFENAAEITISKDELQRELENASSYIIELEEKFYKSQ